VDPLVPVWCMCRGLRVAMVDAEGPMPHDAWFRLLTDQPPLYAHTLPYKVRSLE
jgi:hypothetical protein